MKSKKYTTYICLKIQSSILYAFVGRIEKQERQGRLHVKLSCLSEHVRR